MTLTYNKYTEKLVIQPAKATVFTRDHAFNNNLSIHSVINNVQELKRALEVTKIFEEYTESIF
jgi:hypothetical protein